jgi:hypothetical protein
VYLVFLGVVAYFGNMLSTCTVDEIFFLYNLDNNSEMLYNTVVVLLSVFNIIKKSQDLIYPRGLFFSS